MPPLVHYLWDISVQIHAFHNVPFDCINMLKQLTQASFWIKWVMECTLTIFLSEMVWWQFIKRGIIVNKKRKKERYSKDWASWLWQWRNKTFFEPMISISIHRHYTCLTLICKKAKERLQIRLLLQTIIKLLTQQQDMKNKLWQPWLCVYQQSCTCLEMQSFTHCTLRSMHQLSLIWHQVNIFISSLLVRASHFWF